MAAPKDSVGPERDSREAERRRVLLAGKIVHGEGAFTCDCALRNLSDSGARLRLQTEIVLPKSFYVIELRNGIAHECQVIWRDGTELGVKFTRAIGLDPLADPDLAYLRRIYIEMQPR